MGQCPLQCGGETIAEQTDFGHDRITGIDRREISRFLAIWIAHMFKLQEIKDLLRKTHPAPRQGWVALQIVAKVRDKPGPPAPTQKPRSMGQGLRVIGQEGLQGRRGKYGQTTIGIKGHEMILEGC